MRPVFATAAAEDETGREQPRQIGWTAVGVNTKSQTRWDFCLQAARRQLWAHYTNPACSDHAQSTFRLSRFPEMYLYWPKINVTERKGEGLAAYATIQIKSSEKGSVGGTWKISSLEQSRQRLIYAGWKNCLFYTLAFLLPTALPR